jgi:hypothetical protein
MDYKFGQMVKNTQKFGQIVKNPIKMGQRSVGQKVRNVNQPNPEVVQGLAQKLKAI